MSILVHMTDLRQKIIRDISYLAKMQCECKTNPEMNCEVNGSRKIISTEKSRKMLKLAERRLKKLFEAEISTTL